MEKVMMTKTLAFAVLVGLVGLPVLAKAETPGAAMMAQLLGVEPGAYTIAEMIRLERAILEGDIQKRDFILSHDNRDGSAPASEVTPGEAQMAALLGVDPADHAVNDLTRMLAALAED
jgi:hypothetical protein